MKWNSFLLALALISQFSLVSMGESEDEEREEEEAVARMLD